MPKQNSSFNYLVFFSSFLFALSFSTSLHAEDDPFAFDDDDEYEFEFEVKEKSTLANFPLQAIEGEELSDTAIAGALQATRGSGQGEKDRPAFLVEEENEDKQELSDKEERDRSRIAAVEDENPAPLEIFIPPTAENLPNTDVWTPSPRDYGHHEVDMTFRP